MSLDMKTAGGRKAFCTLGMFIIDEFLYESEDGKPLSKEPPKSQIGGGGTYAAVGARMWLPAEQIGMVVDKGHDFPAEVQNALNQYGSKMWLFRDQPDRGTTRALNIYRGDFRGFDYLTPRLRLTPNDLKGTELAEPSSLHFICSPSRASDILREVQELSWSPVTVYEPIPDRCIPEELPALQKIMHLLSILSPNAEESLSLLGIKETPTKTNIEDAAQQFLSMGVGLNGKGAVVIRSGALGAFITTTDRGGRWVEAYWQKDNISKVVDVTGAGNSFLGGFAAGLALGKDVYEATEYGSVSASFTVEQPGLPLCSYTESGEVLWNKDKPEARLQYLQQRRG